LQRPEAKNGLKNKIPKDWSVYFTKYLVQMQPLLKDVFKPPAAEN